MTVQEIRELIGKKTEEINGYLESRDADKPTRKQRNSEARSPRRKKSVQLPQ